jgi:hypothetical protein
VVIFKESTDKMEAKNSEETNPEKTESAVEKQELQIEIVKVDNSGSFND